MSAPLFGLKVRADMFGVCDVGLICSVRNEIVECVTLTYLVSSVSILTFFQVINGKEKKRYG